MPEKYSAGHPNRKFWQVVPQNWKSAVKHFMQKPMLLNFVNLSTILSKAWNEISKVAKINYKKRILEYKELYTIWDMFTYLIRKLVLMLVVLILFTLLETFLNHWFYLVQCSKTDMMLMDHNLLTVLRLELTFFKMLKTVSFLILHLVSWNNFL